QSQWSMNTGSRSTNGAVGKYPYSPRRSITICPQIAQLSQRDQAIITDIKRDRVLTGVRLQRFALCRHRPFGRERVIVVPTTTRLSTVSYHHRSHIPARELRAGAPSTDQHEGQFDLDHRALGGATQTRILPSVTSVSWDHIGTLPGRNAPL